MDVSVVIVSYNARDHLRRCLESLLRFTRAVEAEVIVVDNASEDGSAGMVADDFPQVRLIRNRRNLGLARATNIGVAAAHGEFILWLNPDCELHEPILGPMLHYLHNNPEVGVLGPCLINPDGTLQLSARSFPGFATAFFNRYSLATKLWPNNPFSRRYLLTDWDHKSIREVDWVSGACMLIPRWLFLELDGLDEAFFMYIEDVDFCYRVRAVGMKVVYFPLVSVIHHIGISTRTAPLRMVWERHRSMWHYYRKHLARGPLFDALVGVAILLRCLTLLLFTALVRSAETAARVHRPLKAAPVRKADRPT